MNQRQSWFPPFWSGPRGGYRSRVRVPMLSSYGNSLMLAL